MAWDILDKKFNRSQKDSFCRELTSERLSHAYIVEGETGFGKTFFAYFAAAAILCRGNVKPCGKCNSCVKINHSTHPDLFVISPEKEGGIITVGMVREIKKTVFFLPNEADKKVYIIKDGNKMNVQAQNALLKFFEEPPDSAVFFILTDKKESLLPTVVSRGRIITLHPSSKSEINAWLYEKFPRKDKGEIEYAASMAEGSPGKALSLLEKKQAEIKDDVFVFTSLMFGDSVSGVVYFFKLKKYDRNKAKEFLSAIITVTNDIIRAKQKFESFTLLPAEKAAGYAKKATETKLMNIANEAISAYEGISANGNINLILNFFALKVYSNLK